MSDDEVREWEETNKGIVLSKRNLESYLFADDVLEALVKRENKEELLSEALKIKEEAITNSVNRGNPPDDLKSAAGEIYNNLKKLLKLQRPGNNTDAFMRDTLAPLIQPGMKTFLELKADIVDRLR